MATPVIEPNHAPEGRGLVVNPTKRRLVSYVLPVYNEADGIQKFHDRLLAATQRRPDLDFEFVYVNDGSRDASLEILERIADTCEQVRVVNFSRNFGHQMAITAGLDHAQGDAVIVMDTDLQDPPEVSIQLVEAWEAGAQIVYAQRRSRKDTPMKRWTAHAYYRVLHRFADINIPVDTGDFRLMDRTTTDLLRAHRERNRFVRGLVALLGILYAIGVRIFFSDIAVPGWTLLMIMVLFMGGVQMLSLGVIGSYVGRIYTEVQARPLYIVDKVVEHDHGRKQAAHAGA
jgi:hypothetical protein